MTPTETALNRIFEDIYYGNIEGAVVEKWLFNIAEAWVLCMNDEKKKRLLLPSAIKIVEEFKLIELIKS